MLNTRVTNLQTLAFNVNTNSLLDYGKDIYFFFSNMKWTQ